MTVRKADTMVEHNSAEACPAELPNFCAQRHWAIFWLLIICSTVTLAGRLPRFDTMTPEVSLLFSVRMIEADGVPCVHLGTKGYTRSIM